MLILAFVLLGFALLLWQVIRPKVERKESVTEEAVRKMKMSHYGRYGGYPYAPLKYPKNADAGRTPNSFEVMGRMYWLGMK
jgi:hypothetical protein